MQKGDFIKLSYIGRLETGEIFDLTDEEVAKKEGIYNPNIKYGDLPVIVGANFLVKGLDNAMLKLNVGDKKDIELKPEEGFGQRNPELVRTVPKKAFKDQRVEPRPGMIVDFGGMKGRIQSVDAGRVRVDFNNPLAGHTVKYHIEIKEKIEEPAEKIKAILEFFGAPGIEASIEAGEATINARLPEQFKEKVSGLVLEYVTGVEKVNFIESYGKKDNAKAANEKKESEEFSGS
jgi:FKBP-type peptidyl-prolyl cis-trans isomerase 2